MSTKKHVILKSSKNGIQLEFDPSVPFAVILDETAKRFGEGRDFFKRAAVALHFSGRSLTDAEENAVINVIEENSDLNVVCLVKEDPVTDNIYIQAIEAVEKLHQDIEDDAWTERCADDNSLKDLRSPVVQEPSVPAAPLHAFEIHAGDITDNTVLDSHNSLLIIGNIDRSSAVVSDGSIIVIGRLLGIAEAGRAPGSNKSIIAALDMSPSKLIISGIPMKTGVFGDRRPKGHTDRLKAAYVQDTKINFTFDLSEIRSILS